MTASRQYLTSLFLLIPAMLMTSCATSKEARSMKRMLRVADYGAVGDGKTDDGPSLRAALAEAAKLSMTDPDTTHVVAFEPNKVYYVDQWHERWETLPIIGARNVVIEGNGAELNVHRNNLAFSVLNSGRVTIRNFVIDYRPLPFTQGEVLDIDRKQGTFLWKLEDGYPEPVGNGFDHGCFIEPAPSWKYTHAWTYIDEVVPLDGRPGIYKIVPSAGSWRNVIRNTVEPKQRFWFFVSEMSPEQYKSRFVTDAEGRSVSSPVASIQLRNSHNCVVENIAHFSSPRMTLRTDGCDDLLVNNVRVIRRPGTTRLCAGNSDAFHGRSIRGPVIENCEFEALGDDSISIGTMPHRVMQAEEGRRLVLQYTDIAWYPSWIAEGQTLVLWDQEAGRELGEAKIVACRLSGHTSYVTLAKAIPGIRTMSDFTGDANYQAQRVTVAFQKAERPIVVRDCRFRTQLKEAVRIGGSVLVEDNVIENTAYGMHLFLFGSGSSSAIRRNRITSAWPFAIGILGPHSVNPAREPTPVRVLIEDNKIRVNALRGLSVCQGLIVFPVENVVLRNNVFHVGSDVESAMQAAVLSRCGTVTVENNKFYDERGLVEKGVLQIADTPSNAVTLKDNEFHTQPGVRHVHREEPAK